MMEGKQLHAGGPGGNLQELSKACRLRDMAIVANDIQNVGDGG